MEKVKEDYEAEVMEELEEEECQKKRKSDEEEEDDDEEVTTNKKNRNSYNVDDDFTPHHPVYKEGDSSIRSVPIGSGPELLKLVPHICVVLQIFGKSLPKIVNSIIPIENEIFFFLRTRSRKRVGFRPEKPAKPAEVKLKIEQPESKTVESISDGVETVTISDEEDGMWQEVLSICYSQ